MNILPMTFKGASEPDKPMLVAIFQKGANQVVFARKMAVERDLGRSRLGYNQVYPSGPNATAVEEIMCCEEDAVLRG